MARKPPRLDAAYSLKTPADSRRLYRDWASTYDDDFAARMDYQMPARIAAVFAASGEGPVLDIGAGTGLVAEKLGALGIGPVDGIDISAEMLQVAAAKGVYRRTLVADLTRTLPIEDRTYRGFVSSGTFTHGHVGPDALDELLRVAVPGAFFALSVHSAVFETAGFDRKLRNLAPMVRDLSIEPVAIYGHGAGGDHATDQALIVSFRRA
ncbi:MAG: class I SAM-dependent methyltransferase [Rhodobacteraceae bacterium]|nr:class I SAM-dependent methyltransferase [Paracoccaceae bacterium]MCP5341221.1 class I SAM-dependent methyltransferase [Paracoccaceae bacterium]